MKTSHPGAMFLPVILLAVLVGGCTLRPEVGPTVPPTPAASPTIAPSPTAAVRTTLTVVAVSVSPPPAERLPDDWISHEDQQFSLSLPPDWQVIELTSGDAQAALENLKLNNPQMAGIIGSAGALQGAALWAFGPVSNEFTDNLNIRRSPLGAERVIDIQGQVLDLLVPQLEKAGFAVTSTDAGLRINDLPAALITYTYPMSAAGKQTVNIRGRQYLVLTDSDLWILSYSTAPERDARMAPIFEQSVRSFRPQ